MSGKRNNLEDSLIVQFERSWLLGSYDGKLDLSAAPARALFQHLLYTPENQLLCRTSLARGAAFQAPVNWVRYVDCCPHAFILPYLWSNEDRLSLAQPVYREEIAHF